MGSSTRPIRVLHVTFNMGIGGTEQVIRQLVNNLAISNFENTIVCIDGNVGEIGKQLEKSGVPIEVLNRKQGFDLSLVRSLHRLIRNLGIDIVHCHQYTPYVYGWMASVTTGVKVVFTEHGRFHPDRYRTKAKLINPVMAHFTDKLVAISEATRGALARYEFMPHGKIDVIYNGIEGMRRDEVSVSRLRNTLGIAQDTFVVGTVSRLDPVKNQGMMLNAFKAFHQKNPESCLLLVGDGPERQKLEQQVIRLGLQNQVIFTGFISQPEDYLAAMDLFLLSSHTEGTSMTLLEAMSLGLPAVVTNVGGNPEIVEDGRTGLVTPPDDSKAFFEAMERIFRDRGLYQQISCEAQKAFMDRFSAKSMSDKYAACYSQLLNN